MVYGMVPGENFGEFVRKHSSLWEQFHSWYNAWVR